MSDLLDLRDCASTKAHITHPELKTTFCLDILGVKKNPSSALYTNLGVITKGTIIEVNVSELGLVTQSGKVVWGKVRSCSCLLASLIKEINGALFSFSLLACLCIRRRETVW